MSVVFQHWNTKYFEAILCAAAESGAHLRGAIPQVGDPIWSMHKKKRNESVLAGELVLTFCKTGKPRRVETNRTFDVFGRLGAILATSPPRVYGEWLLNKLVIDAWERSAIGSVNITKSDLIGHLTRHGWHYDEREHCWVKDGRGEFGLFGAEWRGD